MKDYRIKARESYGLIEQTPQDLAVEVCDALGHGINKTAVALLLETAAAETQLGTYKDPTPNGAGFGICQFDQIPFYDVIARTRPRNKRQVLDNFGYNLDNIKVEDLADDPLLSFILCRLKYKLIPAVIPADVVSRANYWKRYYNTGAGKGTAEHFLESCEEHLYPNQEEPENEPCTKAI